LDEQKVLKFYAVQCFVL